MTDTQADSATTARIAIAAEVRAELARHNKTQRWAGEVLGLHQSSIAMRASGQTPFRGEELVMLAGALGIPVERFMAATAPLAVDAA